MAGGRKAQRRGVQFEEVFRTHCRIQKVTCVRIPDGCRVFGRGKIVRVQTPFDFVIGYGSTTVICDLKSVEGKTLSYSAIVPHQLEALRGLRKHGPTGYVVYFRDSGNVVFVDTTALESIKPRESVTEEHGVSMGTIAQMDFAGFFSRLNPLL